MVAQLATPVESFSLLKVGIYNEEQTLPLAAIAISLTNPDSSVSIYIRITPKPGFEITSCYGLQRIELYLPSESIVNRTHLIIERCVITKNSFIVVSI